MCYATRSLTSVITTLFRIGGHSTGNCVYCGEEDVTWYILSDISNREKETDSKPI